MWTWTNRLADLSIQALDNGTFFRKPWRGAFRLAAVIYGAAGVLLGAAALIGGAYGCYKLYEKELYASGVQGVKVGILVAGAVAFLGLFLSRIWWNRSEDLYTNAKGRKTFLIGPILAHVVRTLGESAGFGIGLYGILTFLVVVPSAEFARSIPFVGEYLFGYLRTSATLFYFTPLVGFLWIMLSRWLADMIEVFFAIANDTRAIRSGATLPAGSVPEQEEVLPFRAGWADVALGLLIYAMLALRLDEITVLLPVVIALALCVQYRCKSSMVFLLAVAVPLAVRGGFMVLVEMDHESVGATYVAAEQPLLIGMLLLLLVAMALLVAERLVHWRSSLTFGQAWAIGGALAVAYCTYPMVKTIQEAVARHELTAAEMQQAQDLFKPYEARRFAWRYMDRVDTSSTFTIGPPVISADRYGLITVQHDLSTDRRRMSGSFQCMYTAIALPDSLVYSPGNGPVSVRYLNGDSLQFHFVNGDQWYTITAVPMDLVQRLSDMRKDQRTAAFHTYRDSLQSVADTLFGRFVSFNCTEEPCFAWFDVEDGAGIAKRSFYCPTTTVDGYPINSLPKDDTRWTIVIRQTDLETPRALAEGKGPMLFELIGLYPETNPAVIEPEEPEKPISKAQVGRPTAAPKPTRAEYRVDEVDQEPSYPGGRSALRRYLAARRYPEAERASGSVRKLRVQFVVSSAGSVEKVTVVGGQGNANFDSEAVRLISAMPSWTPGLKSGVPVAVRMEETVNFSLSD